MKCSAIIYHPALKPLLSRLATPRPAPRPYLYSATYLWVKGHPGLAWPAGDCLWGNGGWQAGQPTCRPAICYLRALGFIAYYGKPLLPGVCVCMCVTEYG